MDMIKPVLFPLSPFPDESLASLLARVAAHNNYDRPGWIRCALEARYKLHSWTMPEIAAAAEILAVPKEEVLRRAYLKSGRGRLFFGHAVHMQAVEASAYKMCPQCLSENGYHSAVLDLKVVTVCPLHACRLLSVCPDCSTAFNRNRPLFSCHGCGADRRALAPEAVPHDELCGVAMLARVAGFPRIHPAVAERAVVPERLSHLSLEELSELTLTLGAQVKRLPARKGHYHAACERSRDQLHMVLQSGFQVIEQWPEQFTHHLAEVVAANRGRSGSAAGTQNLGPLRRSISSHEREPWLTARREVASFLLDHWDGVASGGEAALIEKWSGEPLPYVSLRECRQRMGCSEPVQDALIRAGILILVREATSKRGRRIAAAIDRASVDRICPPGKPLLGFEAMRKRLGLPAHVAYRLIEEGVLRPLLGPTNHGAARHRNNFFSAHDIEQLVGRLGSGYRFREHPPAKLWDFVTVMRIQAREGVSAKKVIDAIGAGRIAPTSALASVGRLSDLSFDAAEALAVIAAINDEEQGQPWVSKAWMSDRLGVHADVADALLRCGHISVSPRQRRNTKVSRASVEAFDAEWIHAAHIARQHRVPPNVINRILREVGGVETIGLDLKNKSPFYRRAQIDALDVSGLLRDERSPSKRRLSSPARGSSRSRVSRNADGDMPIPATG